MNFRYKILKERNSKTDHDRQSWPFFEDVQELLHGDPAVNPVAVASSLTHTASTVSELPVKKKRKIPEPSWVTDFKMLKSKKMLQERIELDSRRLELEERRVAALEKMLNNS